MKIKPVLDALEKRGATVTLAHTGQHFDKAMSEVLLRELNLRPPDVFFGIGSGSHAQQTSQMMTSFESFLHRTNPAAVVVVGDVNSTLACALVTAKSPSLLAHVEAGLRSHDRAMPEEVNRVVTDSISDFLFAPSTDAVDNLVAEGHPRERIHLVGNVMIDSLFANLERARCRPILDDLGLAAGEYGVVTLHRPTNVDDPVTLNSLLDAIGRVSARLALIFPAHPRTRMRLRQVEIPMGIRVIDPLGYLDFIALEEHARVVFTDSGGVQEETTVLGTPCLTLRKSTERPITVTEGTNRLVGRDAEAIVRTAWMILEGEVEIRRPRLWDGHASERIAEVLLESPSGELTLKERHCP
jgi:UDP-N-acetylglucosamine 2-epimerase (non-hydrolysing)